MPSRRKGTVSCSEAFASTAANGISAGAYYRRGPGGNFIQDSFHSSTDMPTYIAWQTLSTDLSERMRQGSVRLSRTNTLEYAPIAEDDEKTPLLNIQDAASFSKSSVSTPTVEQGVAWTVAAFLLVNSALGAGVLNYPAAYDRAGGILAATLLQILMICLNVVTMLILGYCADLNGDNTFHDVLLTTCGRRAQQIAAASILLSCYGVCITFLIVIGDQYDRLFTSLLGPLFCHEWYLNRQFTTCATAVLFILPLCYFQRLDFLKYASTLGIFVMLYPVFLTIFIFSTEELEIVTMKTKPDSLIDLVVILPVICFAYQGSLRRLVRRVYEATSEGIYQRGVAEAHLHHHRLVSDHRWVRHFHIQCWRCDRPAWLFGSCQHIHFSRSLPSGRVSPAREIWPEAAHGSVCHRCRHGCHRQLHLRRGAAQYHHA
ncbi:putative sodium-coupled neutral amino acid transporter 7 isoform X3 [Rhipicephalus sanguineus]|uniref:putative sodium-coupled neutral amino acid transporter 7 isoform X3 n=1 Tax=Rhipicephalus sanguineus TaxID=34632 RepID=UPI0018948DB0|nr:putative sodium-coupled neutral amino acid transporter 7 isoform X3 [Rhipicephalus sanguineus]